MKICIKTITCPLRVKFNSANHGRVHFLKAVQCLQALSIQFQKKYFVLKNTFSIWITGSAGKINISNRTYTFEVLVYVNKKQKIGK